MEDDESWLYGDESQAAKDPEASNNAEAAPTNEDSSSAVEGGEANEEGKAEEPKEANEGEPDGEDVEVEDSDDDSDDDGFKITIDHDKIDEAKTTYQTFGIGKPVRPAPAEKKGKFSVEEFDQIGMINGQLAVDFDPEGLDEKPWRKPGADLSDYFNYGFTEETWMAYTQRQRRMRMGESGAGMPTTQVIMPGGHTSTAKIINTSSFSGHIKTLGTSTSQVKTLSSSVMNHPPPSLPSPAPIAVMTSDKRIYSKKLEAHLDFSMPPPGIGSGIPGIVPSGPPPTFDGPPPIFDAPPPGLVPPGIPPPTFGAEDHFNTEPDFDYSYGGYEPTQESQWSLPPPAESFPSQPVVPGGTDAPPGDAAYTDRERDVWGRRRHSRDNTPTARVSYDRRPDYLDRESSRSRRRRSRSRSRDRYERRDRDREREPERDREREREPERERDRERDRDREKRDRERRRASRSPEGSERHKHKKSKKDKKDKVEIKKEKEDD